MAELFEALVNMTITGSVVIAVIILVRFLLKGMPKKYSYILWAVAGFRLCCPFSFKSIVSIFNINPIQAPSEIVTNNGTMNYIGTPTAIRPDVTQGIPVGAIGGADGPTQVYVASGVFDIFIDFIPWIWLGGFVALLIYALFSFIKLKKSLATATKYDGNIYQSDNISSPFILGIIKPKIYIPYGIESEYLEYVIAHEKYHLKRFDNIIKVFAFLVLALHWFNPLCWVAFTLMNKDMEMSCDEWVLAHNDNIKKQYSSALLSFATNRHFPSPSPLCFGENSAKSRIKNVLKFKKPTVIISVVAIILCIVIAVICIANPKSDNENVKNNIDTVDVSTKDIVQELNNDIMDIIEVSKYMSRAMYIDEIIPETITGVEYVGDSGSGLYCYDFKYKDISFAIPSTSRDISGLMGIFYTVDGQEYASSDEKGNLVFNAGFTDEKQEEISALFMSMADESKKNDYSDVIADISSKTTKNKYYKALMEDKDSTIRYIFGKFCQGRCVHANGTLMRIVMDDIVGDEAIKIVCETGQEYFDTWAKHYMDLNSKNDEKFIKENYPYAYIFLTEYADKMTKNEPVEFLEFNAYNSYEREIKGDKVTFKYSDYDGKTKAKVRWQQNYFDPHAVSAEVVIKNGGEEIYSKPLEIEDVRPYTYNNDVWDYIIEIDPKVTATIDLKLSTIPELYVKVIDSNNIEYKINLCQTVLDGVGISTVSIYDKTKKIYYSKPYDDEYDNEFYEFIYDKYWYGINKDADNIIVYCITHDYYGLTATTVYTRDKNGKWSTENETGSYSFDENDTINYYNSDNDYSRTWWHINTEKKCIEELDKNTSEVIQTLIPKKENNIETAKEIYYK